MDVERVGPSGPASSSERKGRKSTPDSEDFREMMKADKVGETDFDKPKKRKYSSREETPQTSEPAERSRPGQPLPFQPQPSINAAQDEQEPPSAEAAKESQTQQTDKEKKTEDKEKKHIGKNKKEPQAVVVPGEEEMKILPPGKKEKEKVEMIQPGEKIFIQEKKPALPSEKKKEEIQTAKKMPPPKKEDASFSEKSEGKEEKERKKTKISHEISTVLQEMPLRIAQQTQMLTSPLTPYLHPDIVPLFEKMVGAIIQIQSQGITKTQVLLNSPAFTSSIFFGCSIVLEKYSTAPDSFNIFLRGSQQAVIMFNENLEGLFDAFKRGNFNFKVGRLEAEHETLFRRKERAGDKDTDTGSTK